MKHFTHFKAWFIMLMLLVVGVGSAWAEDTPVYSLTFTKLTSGTNYNSYTAAHDITCDEIGWSVYGNQSVENNLRVGGKNTTATDRTLTSTNLINQEIGKITITHSGITNGKNCEITINSIKVEGSTSSNFTNRKSKEFTSFSLSDAGTLEFTLDDGAWGANSYYRITVNYFITKTSETVTANNCYLTIDKIDFYAPDNTTKVLSSISVKTEPTKIVYKEGECFDPSGLVVTASYDNGTSADITYANNESMFSFEPSLESALQTTNKEVKITVKEKSVFQSITVNEIPSHTISYMVNGTAVKSGPEKEGQNLSFPAVSGLNELDFIGWTNAEIVGSQDQSPLLIPNNDKVPSADATYYAVFAFNGGISNINEDLNNDEINSLSAKKALAYADQTTYTGSKINYTIFGYTDNTNRKWIQLKKDKGVYIKITAPGNISKIEVTITSASNTAGGIDNISKHTVYSGYVGLVTTDCSFTNSSTNIGMTNIISNNKATIETNSKASEVMLKVSVGARIWGIKTHFEESGYSNYCTTLPTEQISISSAGYATYVTSNALDFSNCTGIEAFKAMVDNDQVLLKSVTEVPSATAIVVKGAEGNYNVPVIGSTEEDFSDNQLNFSTEKKLVDQANKYYVLANQNGKICFAPVAVDSSIGAKKGYIELTGSGAASLRIVIDDLENGNETAIPEIDPTGEVPLIIYTMTGIRIPKVVEDGLYIVNGKTKWMLAE